MLYKLATTIGKIFIGCTAVAALAILIFWVAAGLTIVGIFLMEYLGWQLILTALVLIVVILVFVLHHIRARK